MLSVPSWVVLPTSVTYSASKVAAWAMTNDLRSELSSQGTQVVGVHVGFVDTDMTRALDVPKSQPDDVVRRALDALEAGADEALADAVSEQVRQNLSAGFYLRAVGR